MCCPRISRTRLAFTRCPGLLAGLEPRAGNVDDAVERWGERERALLGLAQNTLDNEFARGGRSFF
jgi:hypothetical protein